MMDAVVHTLELHWQTWVTPLISGSVMTVVLIGLYMWQERRKRRERQSGYARMLEVELAYIRDLTDPFNKRGFMMRTRHPVGKLSSKAYDGLMSSSNMAVFDQHLQAQLRRFYDAVTSMDYARLRRQVRPLLAEVQQI